MSSLYTFYGLEVAILPTAKQLYKATQFFVEPHMMSHKALRGPIQQLHKASYGCKMLYKMFQGWEGNPMKSPEKQYKPIEDLEMFCENFL